MYWPPRVGEPLPRAAEAIGVRRKLIAYSLNPNNEAGGAKAQGFEMILGITYENLEYLEGAIQTGIMAVKVEAVRENPPHGINCVVAVPVRGLSDKNSRMVYVRTVWSLGGEGERPRMATAFPRP